ncbi:MAG: alanine racemase [Longimicrobiales bacterium]|nr:alanine racemase [Longimicrobiales bacterium]
MTRPAANPGRDAGAALHSVETPVAVVDVARARANARRVAAYAAAHGLAWRPHVKTHKSRRVARLQLQAGARGLTVATPREAEVMSTVTSDLLLAYPPVGEARVRRVASLPAHVRLKVALDSEAVLGPLAAAAREAGRTVEVLVELDVGLRRVGVAGPEAAVALAAAAAGAQGTTFGGLLFYAGHIRAPGPDQERDLAALGDHLRRVYDALDAAGLPPATVSGGTTPTLWRSHEVPGLTEIRPGTCIYNDRDALGQGAARPEDLAYTVLATVVSTAVPGRAAVDAGSKALAKEERGGAGYGVLLDRPEVTVVALSEEHGMLDLSRTDWRPAVGERVRIVPNHVCTSVNLQDAVLAVHPDAPPELWPLEGRGRGPFHPDTTPPADDPTGTHPQEPLYEAPA